MADSPLSRRQFFGTTAAVAAVGAVPAPAAEARPSPLAPEPPPPPGVCQRLGSARFRELNAPSQDAMGSLQFSPDSKWLAHFDGVRFLGYEVATGRRVKWPGPADARDRGVKNWQLVNDAVFVRFDDDDLDGRWPHLYDRETGRRRKLPKFTQAVDYAITPDAGGLIQCDENELRRADLRTGQTVWRRKWNTDASVPAVTLTVTDRWVVTVGVQRLQLFDVTTGTAGPRLEDAAPKDAPPDNHFTLIGFSADGKRVAGWHTAEGPQRVAVWDTTTGKLIGRPSLPEGVSNAALAADGSHLLTTDGSDRLVGYDVRTGRLTRRLAAENVGEFVLSPDGRTLACGRPVTFLGAGFGGFIEDSDGIVRLLDPATGELLPQSPDPAVELGSVRFVDSHTVVAEVGGVATTSHIAWDTRTNRRRVLSCHVLPFNFAGLGGTFLSELSPDATRYLSMANSGPFVNVRLGVTDAVTRRHLHALADAPDLDTVRPFWLGRGAVGAVQLDQLYVWDLADRTLRSVPVKLDEGYQMMPDPAVAADGRTVVLFAASEAEGATPRFVWVDVTTGKWSACDVPFGGNLTASARGDRVAVFTTVSAEPEGNDQLRVGVCDRRGRCSAFTTPTGWNPPFVALARCGRTAFLAHEKPGVGEDAAPVPVVQFWEVLSGEPRAEFATAYQAAGIGVSACGRRVATTHRDAPVYLWDVFGETTDRLAKPDATVWDALDGPADKAFTAIRRLVQHPAAAVELLSAKLTPAEAPKAEWVKARIGNLGSTDFRTRHTAELELTAVADRIAEPLRNAIAAGAESPEADERLTRLLEKAEGIPRSAWRAARAVEALEYCDVPAAVVLLKKLAGGVESAVLTREAKAAVRRIK